MSDSLVIIPTYNEIENVARMVRTVFALDIPFDVLIVDDGSPDGTADAVRALQREYEGQLHLIERAGKLGLGTAYIRGFEWGLERHYQFICEMDCDFSHNPKDLLRLRAACHGDGSADLAVGSRYVPGGKCVNWPADRLILSRGASLYVRSILWMPVMDPTAGFICYRREVLEAIDLKKIRFVGYAFQIEMKYAAHSLGFRIVEVPITFTDRIEGVSKMSKGIVSEAIKGVLSMRWRGLAGSYAAEPSASV